MRIKMSLNDSISTKEFDIEILPPKKMHIHLEAFFTQDEIEKELIYLGEDVEMAEDFIGIIKSIHLDKDEKGLFYFIDIELRH